MHFLKLVGELPKSFKNWIKVRVFREHLDYLELGTKLGKIENNIAIFAIYPGTSPLNSVLRIVKILNKNHFKILAVINDNNFTERYIDALINLECTILVRPNIGADFGAYQAGIRYLKKFNVYKMLSNLILVNDSIYVSRSSEKSISKIANEFNQINCLFLHREGTLHAASMLLNFNSKILRSPKFETFWESYFPYSSKRKIISLGEHKLTKVTGADYFLPYVNSNSTKFITSMKFSVSEVIQILTWSRRTSLTTHTYISKAIELKEFSSVFSYAVFNLHLSNSLGLFMNRVMGVPLKMDLVRAGVVSPEDFLKAPRRDGVSSAEVEELLKIIEVKGSYSTKSLLSRIGEKKACDFRNSRALNGKKHPFS